MNFVDQQIANFKQRMIDEEIARKEALERAEEENNRLMLDKRNEHQKSRYYSDPEFRAKKIAISTKWQEDNRERYNAMIAKWRDENREKVNEYAKLWMRKKRAETKRIQSDK